LRTKIFACPYTDSILMNIDPQESPSISWQTMLNEMGSEVWDFVSYVLCLRVSSSPMFSTLQERVLTKLHPIAEVIFRDIPTNDKKYLDEHFRRFSRRLGVYFVRHLYCDKISLRRLTKWSDSQRDSWEGFKEESHSNLSSVDIALKCLESLVS
jgi:hypothetical protein